MSKVHVETVGHGPPLVLLHGFALHGGLFSAVVPALARRHRVIAVDLPGHGHSPAPDSFTLSAIVASIAQVMASFDEPASILGWSFGGLAALELARLHPARVKSLVLVAATPRFVAAADWPHAMAAQTLARFGDELAVSYRLTLQRFLTLQVQGSEEGRAALAALRTALFARGAPSKATLAGVLRVLAETDLRAEVRGLDTPALVVTGQRDALTPKEAGAWLARTMPRARHVDIAGAAHAPFLSHREAFTAAVAPFVDEHAELSRA
ncbi:MAG TPA: pimeloyl-ACP methyl ester esterase BioH [Casimicrobiaceae bacterium]|nr:pimeloyl-ACP methyl ester esterase BioH [Casimicrobiaceae bacterium]